MRLASWFLDAVARLGYARTVNQVDPASQLVSRASSAVQPRRWRLAATMAWVALVIAGGCKKKEEKPPEPAVTTTQPAAVDTRPTQIDLSGPRPPDVSAVFFGVNGALIPLACYDATKKALAGGPDCGKLVPQGAEVYLASETGALLDAVGAPKNALCEIANEPKSFATTTLNTGAAYDYATWPRPAGGLVRQVPFKTTVPKTAALDEGEKAAVDAFLAGHVKGNKGELRSNQKVKIDVDGDGKDEWIASVTVAHPTDGDQTVFSGLLLAAGGDLKQLMIVDASQRKTPESLILRGVVDLDGNGKSELWVALSFEGGSGERLIVLDNGKAKPLDKWSCGA